jgi:hypothetical protein
MDNISQPYKTTGCIIVFAQSSRLKLGCKSSVVNVTGYVFDGSVIGVRFQGETRDFLYSTASRAGLGSTQPRIEWLSPAYSLL